MRATERASSDPTPQKLPNKDGPPTSAEVVEGRRPAKGNALPQAPCRTQSRADGSSGLQRVRVLVHGSDQLPFPYQLRQPGLDATNWRAELAIRFGVILLSSDANQILKS